MVRHCADRSLAAVVESKNAHDQIDLAALFDGAAGALLELLDLGQNVRQIRARDLVCVLSGALDSEAAIGFLQTPVTDRVGRQQTFALHVVDDGVRVSAARDEIQEVGARRVDGHLAPEIEVRVQRVALGELGAVVLGLLLENRVAVGIVEIGVVDDCARRVGADFALALRDGVFEEFLFAVGAVDRSGSSFALLLLVDDLILHFTLNAIVEIAFVEGSAS